MKLGTFQESKSARYEKRQRERGMAKVCVWVPQEYEAKIKAEAAQYRKRKQNKGDNQ